MLKPKEKIKVLFNKIKNTKRKKDVKEKREEEQEEKTDKGPNYKTLSPTKGANIAVYDKALDFVFSNNEIKNVAIAGAYCSGKSSIIETYEDNNKGKIKLLHISLAHFCAINQAEKSGTSKGESGDNDTTTEKPKVKPKANDKKRSTIEGKILNQLIQQIPSSKIKASRFRIKENVRWEKAAGLSVLLCVFLALLLHAIKFYSWTIFYGELEFEPLKAVFYLSSLPGSRIASAVLLLAIVGYIVFKLIYAQYTKNFIRKISFQGNEFDIGNSPKSSFFDKYLNEVLYIFAEVDANAIVFEDIDRFDDIALFERLREINTLVNIRRKQTENKKVKEKEPLRFIYMMRDDLFVDFKERTKFFDFIIPVIPYLDGSNSYSVLREYLKEDGLIDSFDEDFLKALSYFIDDCRILKNINNELIIYNERLKVSKLELNRLLAIITYKNIFPHDYDELRFNRGFVYRFFAAEVEMKEEICAPYKEREMAIKEEIKAKDEEYEKSLAEVDNKQKNSEPIAANEVNSYIEMQNTKIQLRMEHDRAIKPLNDKLNEIQKIQTEIVTLPLNKLLSRYSKSIFDIEYLKKKIEIPEEVINDKYFGLLKYLLSSGYIDASYADYMTYYYENDASISDDYFIRSVLECNNLGYDYEIDDPDYVIKSLKPFYFSQPAILNFDLYDYIFGNEENYLSQIDNVMVLFGTSQRIDCTEFIQEYILSERNIESFTRYLLKAWKDIFDWVGDKFSDEALRKLISLILKHSDETTLIYYRNSNSKIIDYLSSKPEIFSQGIDRKILYSALVCLNVKFKQLENVQIDSETLDYLYNKNLYELNETNIAYLLNAKCNVNDINKTLKSFFAFVLAHNEYPLCLYIVDNINEVIPVYLHMYKGKIEDDFDSVLYVLNHANKDVVEKYIKQLSTQITNIADINNLVILPLLIEHNLIEYSAENIICWYSHENVISPVLMSFIESNDSSIAFDLNDERTKRFLIDLLSTEGLSDKKFLQIIQSLGDNAVEIIEKAHVSEPKVQLAITSRALMLSPKATYCIRNNYSNLLESYICANIDNYFPAKLSSLEMEDFSLILASSLLSSEKKIELIKKYSLPIALTDKHYPELVVLYILEHNFDSNDLKWLSKNYSSLSNSVQEKVASLIVNNPAEIIRTNKDIDLELKKKILTAKEIALSERIRYLSLYLDDIEKEELCELLLALGADKIANNICGISKNVIVDQTNRSILRILWKKHIIMFPQKTPTEKYYKKLQYINRTERPHIHNIKG